MRASRPQINRPCRATRPGLANKKVESPDWSKSTAKKSHDISSNAATSNSGPFSTTAPSQKQFWQSQPLSQGRGASGTGNPVGHSSAWQHEQAHAATFSPPVAFASHEMQRNGHVIILTINSRIKNGLIETNVLFDPVGVNLPPLVSATLTLAQTHRPSPAGRTGSRTSHRPNP